MEHAKLESLHRVQKGPLITISLRQPGNIGDKEIMKNVLKNN